jgi:hypothetical protein
MILFSKSAAKRSSPLLGDTQTDELLRAKIQVPSFSKLKEEQDLKDANRQLLINQVLDRYNTNKLTSKQAHAHVQNEQIAKFCKRMAACQPVQSKPSFVDRQKQESELVHFAKALFHQWDGQGNGKLKVILLVKHFISLGLASDED